MLMATDSELVRRQGQWINNKIMEIYIQEAGSLQFLPQLPPEVRCSVLEGAALFPTVLKKIYWWFKCGLPEAAWRTMLIEEDMHVHDGWKIGNMQIVADCHSFACEPSWKDLGEEGH